MSDFIYYWISFTSFIGGCTIGWFVALFIRFLVHKIWGRSIVEYD